MSGYKKLSDIAAQISFYVDQLNSGKLSATDIDLLLAELRDLEERVIVLRYKAYEAMVTDDLKVNEPSEFTVSEVKNIEPDLNQVIEFQVKNDPEITEFVAEEEFEAFPETIPFGENASVSPEVEEPVLTQEKMLNPDFASVIQEAMGREPEHHNDLNEAIQKAGAIRQQVVQQTLMIEAEVRPVHQFAAVGQTGGPSLASSFQRSTLRDLTKVIQIGQKYRFIQALFDSDGDAYTGAINQLNSFDNLHDANSFIDSQLKSKYNWNPDSQTVKEFVDLVERMYA